MSYYIVVSNDTFDHIADRLGTTEAILEKANPNIEDINQISVGEHIHIPQSSRNTVHFVKQGDTGISIAKDDDTTFKKLQQLNPKVNWNNLQIGSTIIVPRD